MRAVYYRRVSPTNTVETGAVLYCRVIEEVWKQKPRQTVVVLYWGARSNAALGILAGMCSIVYIAVVHFPFTFVGGDDFCRFPIQVFIYRFDYHLK